MQRAILALLSVGLMGCDEPRPLGAAGAAEQSAANTKAQTVSLPPARADGRLSDGASLENAVSAFRTKVVADENRIEVAQMLAAGRSEDEAFTYEVVEFQRREVDIDDDGDEDVLLLANLCESTNCHTTTRLAYAGVLRNDGSEFSIIRQERFSGSSAFDAYGEGGIRIKSLQIGPDDPHCCPSQEVSAVLSFSPAR